MSGTRQPYFAGTNLKPRKMLEDAARTPIRLFALLGGTALTDDAETQCIRVHPAPLLPLQNQPFPHSTVRQNSRSIRIRHAHQYLCSYGSKESVAALVCQCL